MNRLGRAWSDGAAVHLALALGLWGMAIPASAAEQGAAEQDGAAAAGVRPSVEWQAGKGFKLRSADDKAWLRLGAYVQPALLFDRSEGHTAVDVVLRRVRTSVQGKLPHGFSAQVELAFDEGKFELQDASGAWTPGPALEVTLGRFKPPSGLEREGSPSEQPFAERSAVSALASDRGVGIQVAGAVLDGRIRYAVALMRVPEGVDPALDPGGSDLLARVALRPSKRLALSARGGLQFRLDGASGLEGEDPFGRTFFVAPRQAGTGQQFGLDLSLKLPWVRVALEGAGLREAVTDGTDDGHTLDLGAWALVAVMPFGERGAVEDGAPFEKGLEFLARVEAVRFAPAPGGGDPATLTGLAAGVTAGPSRVARVQVEVWNGWYGSQAAGGLAGERRTVVQLWALFRL